MKGPSTVSYRATRDPAKTLSPPVIANISSDAFAEDSTTFDRLPAYSAATFFGSASKS
jgi:hypothetical protein